MLSIGSHLTPKDTHRLKVKGQKMIFHANINQKGAGVAVQIWDKMDLWSKIVTIDRTWYNEKGTIDKEDITIITPYVSNFRVSKYWGKHWDNWREK